MGTPVASKSAPLRVTTVIRQKPSLVGTPCPPNGGDGERTHPLMHGDGGHGVPTLRGCRPEPFQDKSAALAKSRIWGSGKSIGSVSGDAGKSLMGLGGMGGALRSAHVSG